MPRSTTRAPFGEGALPAPLGGGVSRALFGIGVALGLALPGAALANDRAACFDAASQGQTLRDAHKLIEARAKFQACAQASCPSSMQTDCAGWLDGVERALPTVVLAAKDAAGQDVLDVAVTLDGVPVTQHLDGRAFPVNPGPHEFRFEVSGGVSATQHVLITEGEKARVVQAALAIGAPRTPAVPPQAPAASKPSPSSSSPLRTVGWTVLGIGVAGLATGVALFAVGSSDRSGCPGGDCSNPSALDKYNGGTTLLNAGYGLLIGGGVAAAAGIVLWIVSPSRSNDEPSSATGSVRVRFTPSGIAFEGAF